MRLADRLKPCHRIYASSGMPIRLALEGRSSSGISRNARASGPLQHLLRPLFAARLAGFSLFIAASLCNAQPPEAPQEESLWQTTLDEGIRQATESNKPIFVIVGAEWCVYCKQLEEELAGVPTETISERWVLVKIDADRRVSDAREMRASGLPSLRLLSKDGLIAASQDGYMPVDSLIRWLEKNYRAVKSNVPGMLEIDPDDYSDEQVADLVEFVAIRDVTVRRIVIDRLAKIPQRCVAKTIDLLESRKLAKQLSALELLRRWQAPVEGLDPWIPESIDPQAIKRLKAWSEETYPSAVLET